MYVVRNGFTIEIYRFTHSLHTSLVRVAHDSIAMEVKVDDSEDRRQCQNESRLLNKRMKDDKITVTRNNLHFSTRVIYFAR